MPTLDVFNSDAFSVRALTAAIIKAPHQPTLIGDMGWFKESGIVTTTVQVEEVDGQLSLIQTSPYGAPAPDPLGNNKRKLRAFTVPHLAREAKIYAAEIQNVRAFGSETEVQTIEAMVAQKLAVLRAMRDVTLEYHRIGAIKGAILDADGTSTVVDLHAEFGTTQTTHDFQLSSSTLDVRGRCTAALRLIETELGGSPYSGATALCSAGFFDALISHAEVTKTFQYQEGEVLRRDLRRGFVFGGITWMEYRGSVSKPDGSASVGFITGNEAILVPEGVMTVQGPMFQTWYAPADFEDTVNTIGQPMYARQSPDPEYPAGQGRYRKLHMQCNPLCMNLRPKAVLRITKS